VQGTRYFGWVTCPGCGDGRPCVKTGERLTTIPGGVKWHAYSGRCGTCDKRRRRKYKGTKRHVSGARILWDELPVGSRSVPFICRERDIGKHKSVVDVYTARTEEWSGRCEDCRRRLSRARQNDPDRCKAWVTCPDCPPGANRRFVNPWSKKDGARVDEKRCKRHSDQHRRIQVDEPVNDGSIILWSQEKDGIVPFYYGACGHTRNFPRRSVVGRHHKPWPDRCRMCFLNADVFRAAILERAQQPAVSNGNGHANSDGKERFDRSVFRSDLDGAIDAELTLGTPPRKITRKKIAKNYPLGGEYINPDALTKRMRLSGVELSFDDYVESRAKLRP